MTQLIEDMAGRNATALGDVHIERWSRALPGSALATLSTGGQVLRFAVVARDSGERALITVAPGTANVAPSFGSTPEFALVADASDWQQFFSPLPPPLFHSVFAMRMRVPSFRIEGDEHRFAQFAGHVRRAMEVGRASLVASTPTSEPSTILDASGIHGRYISIPAGGRTAQIYVEQAGEGPDLLLLHTAGSDCRQLHPLLNDPRLTSRFRITAFDLPGHGRSASVPGQLDGRYSLTLDAYRSAVLDVVGALKLDRPIVSGASMAGEICLELAISAPSVFGGIVACEASDHVPGRRTPWMQDPTIDTAIFSAEWIHGLLAPQSPVALKELVMWTYSQGGAGTFAGDIDFYSGGWDARDRVSTIDTRIVPLILMTGEYDYSCTPEMSRATAARIRGAHYVDMPGLGHFPLSENPDLFIPHLLRAVEIIRQESRSRS